MKTGRVLVGGMALLALAFLATHRGLANEGKTGAVTPSGAAHDAPMAGCTEMMPSAGVTDEGKRAMREFMQSDRGKQAMANMMEMARKMGNGDAMLGMTRMMEMMGSMGGGSMGGMMHGPSGTPTPGGQPPSK